MTRKRRSRQEETGRDDLLSPISPVPREVVVPVLPSRKDELEAWLSGIRGSAVSVRVASRGEKRALMERANTNAQQTLMRIKSSRMTDMGIRTQALNEIAEALGLKEAPLRIECYDISNASGGGTRSLPWSFLKTGSPQEGVQAFCHPRQGRAGCR